MQDGIKKTRGRPRHYDRDTALDAMVSLFWRQGFAATSLDQLSDVTGMVRPSLYQAFGSKQDMYVQALQHFVQRMTEPAGRELREREALADALLHFYYRVLEIYFEESHGLGCMVFCTAVADAHSHPEIRNALAAVIEQVNAALGDRLQRAKQCGQLSKGTDIPTLATLAQALLQHLAIQARAGESQKVLRATARSSVQLLLAPYRREDQDKRASGTRSTQV